MRKTSLGLVLLALCAGCAGGAARPAAEPPAERRVGAGDDVQCFLPPTALAGPDTQPLALLARTQRVAADGTLFVPFVGAVPVVGLTERELGCLVTEQMQAVYDRPIQVQARIVSR